MGEEEEEEGHDAHLWKIERRKFKNTSSSSGGESKSTLVLIHDCIIHTRDSPLYLLFKFI